MENLLTKISTNELRRLKLMNSSDFKNKTKEELVEILNVLSQYYTVSKGITQEDIDSELERRDHGKPTIKMLAL